MSALYISTVRWRRNFPVVLYRVRLSPWPQVGAELGSGAERPLARWTTASKLQPWPKPSPRYCIAELPGTYLIKPRNKTRRSRKESRLLPCAGRNEGAVIYVV
ncbi:predicted protein [Coccidioides posadasii str. Silveira]|uniref:Predicted protein n=1 Tax=Coccidioides posadasii (strain RMSCC 757 / Silveira) TaxID=443226 RepID=E9DJ54_COCPS|nr:predicted protein [Coccidioides posadasii str. Silveira]